MKSILGWYIISISLHVYNKLLFSKDHFNFPFPVFTTLLHMWMQFSFSAIVLAFIFPSLTPRKTPLGKDILWRLLPCGLAMGIDIGLSNASLKVISLSFYTMVKSGAPIFVVLFVFLFGLEKPTWLMFGTMAIICTGMLLMVTSETMELHFDLGGYLQVQTATVFSGLRWALTQILLERESMGMTNPIVTTFYLAPVVSFTLLVAFFFLEGPEALVTSPFYVSFYSTMNIMGIIGFGGMLAFFMSLAEYKLISSTSVITFTVAGIVKEIITIATASIVFKDIISGNKVLGLVISIFGIALYNYIKIWKKDQPYKPPIQTLYNELELDELDNLQIEEDP